MNKLPKTLLKALNVNDIVCDCDVTIPKNIINTADKFIAFKNLQFYAITDKLIEATGRFCEHFGSDLLIDINSIKTAMLNDDDGLYYIGIRKNGVDHNSYVFLNLKDKTYASEYYRALYAVEFHRDKDYEFNDERRLKVMLKNMNYLSFDKEDIDFPVEEIDDLIKENNDIN